MYVFLSLFHISFPLLYSFTSDTLAWFKNSCLFNSVGFPITYLASCWLRARITPGKYANHVKSHFRHIFKHLQQQEGEGITTHQFTHPWHMKHGIVNTIPLLLHVDG
jgi:hypothetical protein